MIFLCLQRRAPDNALKSKQCARVAGWAVNSVLRQHQLDGLDADRLGHVVVESGRLRAALVFFRTPPGNGDESGGVAIFVVNRSLDCEIDATIDLAQFGPVSQVLEAVTMSGPDYMLTNSADAPDRVTPQPNSTARVEGSTVRVTLPAVSWSMIRAAS